jgi:hypothetical protein
MSEKILKNIECVLIIIVGLLFILMSGIITTHVPTIHILRVFGMITIGYQTARYFINN